MTASKKNKQQKKQQIVKYKSKGNTKVCIACRRPLKAKGYMCIRCKMLLKEVNHFLDDKVPAKDQKSHVKDYRNNKVSKRKYGYIVMNVIGRSDEYSVKWWFYYHKTNWWASIPGRGEYRKKLLTDFVAKAKTTYNVSRYNDVPYIFDYLTSLGTLELKEVSGTNMLPIIKFKCQRCDKEYTVKFDNVIKHHSSLHKCPSAMPTGEAIVMKYLDMKHIKYRTQRDTLKCINPDTGHQLPYDFELTEAKAIIEVQGDQHYKWVKYFFKTEEEFEKRLKDDKYKKDFAISQGYQYLEIPYEDFKGTQYQYKINQLFMS
ncbi:hypothetical protein [Ligilactobacillus acidipiscis]|uniref:hypothetical protein n=1 Tax=Ligilactobacillus acidipiscis TaxID=89059 RepID=UPI0023F88700|nr:hypothetical protein [Ligilactobacillus acidipiscis]WEV57870.1 hypothetical protein OZX66_04845 [Ligilactobacillus acidipiscis]